MNEEFQKYLMGILEKTGEFLSNEIPDVANQILNFYLSISIMYLIIYCIRVYGNNTKNISSAKALPSRICVKFN